MKEVCRPIKVEVLKINDDVREELLEGWKEPKYPEYKGMHGIKIPTGESEST